MKIFLFIFFSIINKISPIKEYEFGNKDYCKTHKSSFIWSKNAIIIAIYETILVFITFLNCLFLYIRKIIINRRERNNRQKKSLYEKKLNYLFAHDIKYIIFSEEMCPVCFFTKI